MSPSGPARGFTTLSFRLERCTDSAGAWLQPALGPACDQCRRKKARCDRQESCQTCARQRMTCSYNAAPKPRGRRPRKNGLRVDAGPSEAPVPSADKDVVLRPSSCHVQVDDLATDSLPSGHASTKGYYALHDGPDVSWTPMMSNRAPTPPLPWFMQLSANMTATSPVQCDSVTHLSDSAGWTCTDGTASLSHPPLPLQAGDFRSYIHVFLARLYPVFPVVDKDELYSLLQSIECGERPFPLGLYACLAALSAAVMVQLNVAGAEHDASSLERADSNSFDWPAEEGSPSQTNSPPSMSAQFFADQCLDARRRLGFIESCDEWTVLTSFFLFAYYGNLCQSQSAWYYLRETIGFLQALRLDEEESYIGLETTTAQRRRRLFWLVFITERAYALQHRRKAILRPDIDLPGVFESREPRLAYGFVTLAKLFASVDDSFLSAWSVGSSTRHRIDCSEAQLRRLSDAITVLPISEIEETQRLDILITEKWLRMLDLQLHMGNARRTSQSEMSESRQSTSRHALDLSRGVLQIIASAAPSPLQSHGIGMEQKVSDVANWLCDVMTGSEAGQATSAFFSAPDYLHNFMKFLAGFRNHRSQYFGPLAQRTGNILDVQLRSSTLLFTEEEINDLVGMESQDAAHGDDDGQPLNVWSA